MKRISRHVISMAMLSITLLALTSSTALAQVSECSKKRQVGIHALDEFTWKRLNKVYENMAEEHYEEAFVQLQKMLTRAGNSSYLQAVLNQALAQVAWIREDFVPALEYLEWAVQLDVLPDQTHYALMYQIAQLYFMQERYGEALDRLELWFCKSHSDKITTSAWALKASIYAQQENYIASLQAIEIAIDRVDQPSEQWYQLKLAALYQLEQYARLAQTLELVISLWPQEKKYWIQLSQIYLQLGQDEKALAVIALAYLNGMLDTQAGITYLSNLYRKLDLPFKAAQVLEQGLKDGLVAATRTHWSELAEAWYLAQELENSLIAYENAGKASSDGRIDLRRGYILVDLERWPDALNALNDTLAKGGLSEKNTGEAYLLRGVTQFHLENFDRASADWGQAGSYDHISDAARQWMNYLQSRGG